MIKSLKKLAIFAGLVALSATAVAITEEQRAAIEERIRPHGQVCLEGDTSCGVMAAPGAGAMAVARSGEEVYNSACMACHNSGAAGAPKLGDVAAWSPRISKGRDALHNSGLNGVAGTGMIAKGGCMACSDEEIIAAVDYMIDSAQ
ncbi:MAG: c-type cytochrome [Pseudomonadota bacterium]